MQKKRTFNNLLICTGVLLLVAAVSIYGYYEWTNAQATRQATELLQGLTQKPDKSSPPTKAQNTTDIAAQHTAFDTEPSTDTTISFDDTGILTMPSIDITLPVLPECNDSNLKRSVCLYDKPTDGQWIIAGHSYDGHFGKIPQLRPGDTVTWEIGGYVRDLQVQETVEIRSDDFETLYDGTWTLTLFTCNYNGNRRILVRCG